MTTSSEAEEARQALLNSFPKHRHIFADVVPVLEIKREPIPFDEAVIRVVIGQMISGATAFSIYNRVVSERDRHNLNRTWELSPATLKKCGVNRKKIRAIQEFANACRKTPERIQNLEQLDSESFFNEIGSFWGMSNWTASMLCIFYLGHKDVFPAFDGSIQRALEKIKQAQTNTPFNPNDAAPYRSYLAKYLWHALDSKRI